MAEDSEWVTGNVTLSIGGVPLKLEMTVPAKPVKPQRVLPVLQQIASAFAGAAEDAASAEGRNVTCSKGCGACCRQGVPLAEFEAFAMAELVEAMPEPRRTEIRGRFERAVAHFAGIGWFERLRECESSQEMQEQVIREYFAEGIPCPFLEDEACSIHQDRPMTCREYLVTSPPEYCGQLDKEGIERLPLLARPAVAARSLGQVHARGAVNFIPLVLALAWAEKTPDTFPERTGEQWMAEFFGSLTKSAPPTASKT